MRKTSPISDANSSSVGRRTSKALTGDILQHPIQQRNRAVEPHRRVHHQYPAEAEDLLLRVQVAHVRGVEGAETVAGQVVVGDLQLALQLVPNLLHHPVEIRGVVERPAGHPAARGGHDKIGAHRRAECHHVEALRIERPGRQPVFAAVMGRAGAGDGKDQRRRPFLRGIGIAQFLVVPERVRRVPLQRPGTASLERDVSGQRRP